MGRGGNNSFILDLETFGAEALSILFSWTLSLYLLHLATLFSFSLPFPFVLRHTLYIFPLFLDVSLFWARFVRCSSGTHCLFWLSFPLLMTRILGFLTNIKLLSSDDLIGGDLNRSAASMNKDKDSSNIFLYPSLLRDELTLIEIQTSSLFLPTIGFDLWLFPL